MSSPTVCAGPVFFCEDVDAAAREMIDQAPANGVACQCRSLRHPFARGSVVFLVTYEDGESAGGFLAPAWKHPDRTRLN